MNKFKQRLAQNDKLAAVSKSDKIEAIREKARQQKMKRRAIQNAAPHPAEILPVIPEEDYSKKKFPEEII